MLIQFSVANYASIRDEITLSLIAGTGSEHEERLIGFEKENLLPVVSIFGANAAGKTNIHKALTAAIMIVRSSHQLQIDSSINYVVPFWFDKTHKNEPTKFDFIFIVNDTKYQYGFVATRNQIIEEYLYKYNSSWASMVFERTNVTDYKFTKANENHLKSFVEKTSPNKLFLSTATMWNCKLTEEAYRWFAESIDSYDSEVLVKDAIPYIYDQGDEIKPFMKKMLSHADFNITDYVIERKEVPMKSVTDSVTIPGIEISPDPNATLYRYEISTAHDVEDENGVTRYYLPFELESKGTQKFFELCPAIKTAIDNGKTLFVDEMDTSMHPFLLDYIVDIFNDKEINKNGAQLVFNSHSVNTLSLEKFRRDQIYLVEKNNVGVTELFSIDEFSPRKTDDVRKRYLEGRYGALPNIVYGEW